MLVGASARVIGTSHVRSGTVCQDFASVESSDNGTESVAVLCDGAGSCSRSELGAEALCHGLPPWLREESARLTALEDEELGREIVIKGREILTEVAEEHGVSIRDLSSTLLIAWVHRREFDLEYRIIHLGDGIAACIASNGKILISTPERGEFANETIFVPSKGAKDAVKVTHGAVELGSGFLLMSDGTAESLFLKRCERLAPACADMLAWLNDNTEETVSIALEQNLQETLSQKTDDDCSLVLLLDRDPDIRFEVEMEHPQPKPKDLPAQSVVSSLRDISASVPSSHVVEHLAEQIRPMSAGRIICFEFFSLGDLLKGTIILAAFRAAFPNTAISVRLREEYHDKDGILAAVALRYSAKVDEESPSSGPTIGVFDTSIPAYRARTKDYPAVIPTQHLSTLHGIGVENAGETARKILGISPQESVLVIGCYTSTELKLDSLEHIKDPLIRKDFVNTHAARYISHNSLKSVLSAAVTRDLFDRVILVPRNISEEGEQIKKLGALPFIEAITDRSKEPPSAKVLLLLAKGVLRAAYAAANVSVVMGYHNVLEPFLCNQKTRAHCFEPPLSAPNRFLFECGIRHGLLKCFSSIPSADFDEEGFLEQVCLDSFDADPEGFEQDPLFKESLQSAANAMSSALKKCSIR